LRLAKKYLQEIEEEGIKIQLNIFMFDLRFLKKKKNGFM